MGDLLIRDIPQQLKAALEAAARRDGTSLSAKSIELLHQSLASGETQPDKPFLSAWEALRPLMYDGSDDAEAQEYATIMEDVESERKRDFGRPVPDVE